MHPRVRRHARSSLWQDDVPADKPTGWVFTRWRRHEVDDQAITESRDRLQDKILIVEWFAREKELRDALVDPSGHVKVEMWRPSAGGIERIGPRFDRREADPPLAIRELDAVALEVRIERRRIGIGWMVVATKGVRLPELYAGAANRFVPLVKNPSSHVNDLSLRPDAMATDLREIGIPVRRLDDGIERPGSGGRRRGQVPLGPSPQRAARHPHTRDARYDAKVEKLSSRGSLLICVHFGSPTVYCAPPNGWRVSGE